MLEHISLTALSLLHQMCPLKNVIVKFVTLSLKTESVEMHTVDF